MFAVKHHKRILASEPFYEIGRKKEKGYKILFQISVQNHLLSLRKKILATEDKIKECMMHYICRLDTERRTTKFKYEI